MKSFGSARLGMMRRSRSGAAGLLLWPLLGACLWATVVGYKPVIIVHGLFDSSGDFKHLERFINEVSAGPNKYSKSQNTLGMKTRKSCRPYRLYHHMLSSKRGSASCNKLQLHQSG